MDIKSNYQKGEPINPIKTGNATEPDLLADSDFIAGLRAQFFTSTGPIWPGAGVTTPEQAFDDLAAAARVLFLRCENRTVPVTVSGAPGSAEHIVSSFLAPLSWPDEPPDVPEAWDAFPTIYRRYEVGRAVDLMLEAYNFGSGGSGGTGWPPKIPSLVVGPSP